MATDGEAEGTETKNNGDAGAGAGTEKPASMLDQARAAAAEKDKATSQADKVTPPGEGGFDMAQLPEHLRADSEKDALGKVFKAYQGLRDNGAKAPATADDYKFEISADAKPYFPEIDKDPLLKAFRGTAHEAGLDQGQFEKIVGGVTDALAKEGVLEKPIDTAAETARLGGEDEAFKRINTLDTWLSLQKTNKVLSEAEHVQLSLMMAEADGVTALEKLMKLGGQQGPGTGGDAPGQQGYSLDDWRRDMKDPRYDTHSPKYDPDFRARVDGLGKAAHSRR